MFFCCDAQISLSSSEHELDDEKGGEEGKRGKHRIRLRSRKGKDNKKEVFLDTVLPETSMIRERKNIAFTIAGEEIVFLCAEASAVPCRISCEAFLELVRTRLRARGTSLVFENHIWILDASERLNPDEIWANMPAITRRYDKAFVEVMVVLRGTPVFEFFDDDQPDWPEPSVSASRVYREVLRNAALNSPSLSPPSSRSPFSSSLGSPLVAPPDYAVASLPPNLQLGPLTFLANNSPAGEAAAVPAYLPLSLASLSLASVATPSSPNGMLAFIPTASLPAQFNGSPMFAAPPGGAPPVLFAAQAVVLFAAPAGFPATAAAAPPASSFSSSSYTTTASSATTSSATSAQPSAAPSAAPSATATAQSSTTAGLCRKCSCEIR